MLKCDKARIVLDNKIVFVKFCKCHGRIKQGKRVGKDFPLSKEVRQIYIKKGMGRAVNLLCEQGYNSSLEAADFIYSAITYK